MDSDTDKEIKPRVRPSTMKNLNKMLNGVETNEEKNEKYHGGCIGACPQEPCTGKCRRAGCHHKLPTKFEFWSTFCLRQCFSHRHAKWCDHGQWVRRKHCDPKGLSRAVRCQNNRGRPA